MSALLAATAPVGAAGDESGGEPWGEVRLAQARGEAACLVGRASGVAREDAEAAAALLCAELRALGVAVGEPRAEPGEADEAFRVDLSRLGTAVVLELSYEAPVGVRQHRERRQLPGIEGLFEAAPGLAQAMLEPPPPAGEGARPEPAAPGGGIPCLIGEHEGIAASDARTATSLVCDELRAQGVAVGAPATSAGSAPVAYSTTMRRLGAVVILEVAREAPPGRAVDSRRIQLASLEEVAVAAPRAAEALVRGVPMAETSTMGTLVGEETRALGERPGRTFWGVGIAFAALAGADVHAAPGFNFRFFYETLRFGVGTDLLLAGGLSGGDSAAFFSWSVGARYFFSETNASFFAGGGLAWDTLVSETGGEGDYTQQGTDTGLGVYGDVGWEFLREHSSRLTLTLRVDVPLFQVTREREEEGFMRRDDTYVVPVTLTVGYAW
jgi:hypothetical protein